MTTLIKFISDEYRNFVMNDKYADVRTKDEFLVSSPLTLFFILYLYLYFCMKAGPELMRQRKPFQLKRTLLVYNICQVLISVYLAWEGTSGWLTYDDWMCQPRDLTYNPKTAREIRGASLYLMAKLTELLDTVLFVLRKKQSQISFLHLFHHTVMPFGCWVGLRYLCCGHSVLLGIINSYVHIVMYGYYLLAGLGPSFQKYLWWKKYVTVMQLVQFTIIFVHNFIPLFTSCTYPKVLHLLLTLFSLLFMYLFGSFYYNAYVKKKVEKVDERKLKKN